MFPYRGLMVSSWVSLEGGADIEYLVYGDQVELCFGGRRGNFQIHATEDGLAELITKGSAALHAIRAGDADE